MEKNIGELSIVQGKMENYRQMQIAVWTGDHKIVEELIEKKIDVNGGEAFHIPLCLAAWKSHLIILSLLIQAGADVNKGESGVDPTLMGDAKWVHDDYVNELVKTKVDISTVDAQNGDTALLLAVRHGNIDCVKILLNAKANVNSFNRLKCTPLILAGNMGKEDILQVLLQANADIHRKDVFGETATIKAAGKGHVSSLRLLIEAGGNVNDFNKHGHSPLILAIQYERDNCVQLLLDAGADLYQGCLLGTVKKGKIKIVSSLIKAGSDVNFSDDFGRTALMIAASGGFPEMMEILIKAGADVNAVNVSNNTALNMAAMVGSGLCVRQLILKGAEINIKNDKNETAFSLAASAASLECVKMLLSAGSHINKGKINWSVFLKEIKMAYDPVELVKVLQASGQEIDSEYKEQVHQFSPQFKEQTLSNLCRESIRKHLININAHSHLYNRVPRIELAESLKSYLLYNTSLHGH